MSALVSMPFIVVELVAALPNSAVAALVKHQLAVAQRMNTGLRCGQLASCRLKRHYQCGVAELSLFHTVAGY